MVAKLEAALIRREAETVRLRRIEAATTTALADLDAMLGDADASINRRQKTGAAG